MRTDGGRCVLLAVVALAMPAAPAGAVKTALWTHEQPSDFTAGKLDNLVTTSQGELMLGRQIDRLLEAGDRFDAVNALAQAADGRLYAATGPEGVIYRIDGDKAEPFARLPEGAAAMSLLFAADDRLLVGTGGGEQARIFTIDAAGRATLFHAPAAATYVWAMARGAGGEIFAATGIEGQLHRIEPDGSNGRVLADLKPRNILSLAFGPDGMLYAGTDEEGLVCRIHPETGAMYVMYDAAESEISAIATDDQGNLYAATASAERARPGRQVADKPGGRPDRGGEGSEPPAETRPAGEPGAQRPAAGAGMPAPGTRPERRDGPRMFIVSQASQRGGDGQSTRAAGSAAPGTGNAIYRIDTRGFVTEIFRQPVMILALAEAEGTIYAATGDEGRVYAITPGEDRTTMLARLEPQQATCLIRQEDGGLVVGTANAGSIARIRPNRAARGTLTSKPLDAGQIVKWGRLRWTAEVPTGTKLTVATRSGNVADEESTGWDEWSPEMDATTPQLISSPGARFLQYRLTFETSLPEATPVLRRLIIPRIEENRPPEVKSVQLVSVVEEAGNPGSSPKVKQLAGAFAMPEGGPPAPQSHWVIKWQAEDPNQDKLSFDVFFRAVGSQRWIRMAKELDSSPHIWDTRTVADGAYVVRLVASDAPGNPRGTELSDARISDPLIVDNTPPKVRFDDLRARGPRGLSVRVVAEDALSPLSEAACSVNSSETWRPLVSEDEMIDAPVEAFSFELDDLDPGEQIVTVRVTDERGNSTYAARSISTGP